MKSEIRQQILKTRQNLGNKQRADLSVIISNKLTSLSAVIDSKCIMAYYAYRGEVDLSIFMEFCISRGIRIALPRIVNEGVMEAAEYKGNSEMQQNRFGIFEPTGNRIERESIDAVIAPAVAFDQRLYRLGYGGGYYDRFLKDADAVKIGVCYDFQIVERLPSESHDVKMDMVISEKSTLGAV